MRPSRGRRRLPVRAVNEFFGCTVGEEHITGAYAGVRPLISTGDNRKSVDISRKAELYETSSGLITITGGKLTTWRRMAKLAVDRLVERDGRQAPCRTHEIPLGAPADAASLPRVQGVAEAAYEQLAARYGHAAERVLETASGSEELAQAIVPGLPDLLAEAPFAARNEQARSVSDVLMRRTRLGLLAARELCEPASEIPAEWPGRWARSSAGTATGWLGRSRPSASTPTPRASSSADRSGSARPAAGNRCPEHPHSGAAVANSAWGV